MLGSLVIRHDYPLATLPAIRRSAYIGRELIMAVVGSKLSPAAPVVGLFHASGTSPWVAISRGSLSIKNVVQR